MSDFARHLRYPNKLPPDASDDQTEDCIEVATRVWEAVTADLARSGVKVDC